MATEIIRDFLRANPDCSDFSKETDPGLSFLKLLEWIAPYGIVVGGIYQHFKGDRYRVTGFVRPADDWENLRVKYVQVDNVDHEADRSIAEFLDDVKRDDYTGPRFRLVGYGWKL